MTSGPKEAAGPTAKSITVRYFAMFRERAGTASETLVLHADTARDVFVATRGRHGSADPGAHCKVAINDEMSHWEAPVRDGDEVLLFPPVAGG